MVQADSTKDDGSNQGNDPGDSSRLPNETELALKYAWDWFHYHASQRLTAFRFYLIIVAAILAGYINSFDNELYPFSSVLALIGAIVSFVFLQLDRRNEELVNHGRDLLDELEQEIHVFLRRRDDVKTKEEAERLAGGNFKPQQEKAWEREPISKIAKHRKMFRFLQILLLILFLAAAGWSFWSMYEC